jgi:hypothetical protein
MNRGVCVGAPAVMATHDDSEGPHALSASFHLVTDIDL